MDRSTYERIRSVTVVLPASIWAMIPMLRSKLSFLAMMIQQSPSENRGSLEIGLDLVLVLVSEGVLVDYIGAAN